MNKGEAICFLLCFLLFILPEPVIDTCVRTGFGILFSWDYQIKAAGYFLLDNKIEEEEDVEINDIIT
jgi:hypothetical protein